MCRLFLTCALSFAAASLHAADNVDTAASEADRVAHMKMLVTAAVEELDSTASASTKANTVLFLMRVAWHEGAQLSARRQNGGGPGRSFFQFEPGKVKDGVDHAVTRNEIVDLATSGGSTSQRIQDSEDDLTLGAAWPSDGLIERLLGDDDDAVDLFAIYLARIALKRIPAAIPADVDGHATYWADHWKVSFDSPADRTAKIAQFKTNATALDAHL